MLKGKKANLRCNSALCGSRRLPSRVPDPGKRLPGNRLRAAVQERLQTSHSNGVNLDQQLHSEKSPQSTSQQAEEVFVWRANWYPVALQRNLDKSNPNRIVLLNDEILVWWDENSKWHAAVDKPRSMTSPSEGSMDHGILESHDHGLQFRPDSHQCSTSFQNSLQTYPTEVGHGMLWIWPQSGRNAAKRARANALPLYEGGDGPGLSPHDHDFYEVVLPASWFLSVENFLDPSHANCLHENGPGCGSRSTMAYLKMEVTSVQSNGVQMRHNGYSKMQQAMNMSATRELRAPCVNRSTYSFGSGASVSALIYMVPESPEKTRAFGKFLQKGYQMLPPSPNSPLSGMAVIRARLSKLKLTAKTMFHNFVGFTPIVDFHTASQQFTNQDALVMAHSQHHMARSSHEDKPSHAKTPSKLSHRGYSLQDGPDQGVAGFWKWVDDWGGEPDWGVQRGFLPRNKDRKTLFNHHARHTVNCVHCLKAEKRISVASKWLWFGTLCLSGFAAFFAPTILLRLLLVTSAGLLYKLKLHLASLDQLLNGFTFLPDESEPPLPF